MKGAGVSAAAFLFLPEDMESLENEYKKKIEILSCNILNIILIPYTYQV